MQKARQLSFIPVSNLSRTALKAVLVERLFHDRSGSFWHVSPNSFIYLVFTTVLMCHQFVKLRIVLDMRLSGEAEFRLESGFLRLACVRTRPTRAESQGAIDSNL